MIASAPVQPILDSLDYVSKFQCWIHADSPAPARHISIASQDPSRALQQRKARLMQQYGIMKIMVLKSLHLNYNNCPLHVPAVNKTFPCHTNCLPLVPARLANLSTEFAHQHHHSCFNGINHQPPFVRIYLAKSSQICLSFIPFPASVIATIVRHKIRGRHGYR